MNKNPKRITLTLSAVLVGVLGLLVLQRLSAVQGQADYPPTPEPPTDDGIIVPPCCDDSAPIYHTPGSEEMTAIVRITQEVIETQQAVPTRDPRATEPTTVPVASYLAPAEEWRTYTETTDGYSFEFPANWFVYDHGEELAITNFNLEQLPPNLLDPARFRANIYRGEDLGDYPSLEAYVSGHVQPGDPRVVLSQELQTLPNGYLILRQEKTSTVPSGTLVMFITNGIQVYQLYGPALNSTYIGVVNHIVDTFVIP